MSIYCVELPYQKDATLFYAAVSDLPWSVWLDSCGMERFEIVTAAPMDTLLLYQAADHDSFSLVRELLGEQLDPLPDVPFAGGALGYWSYDLSLRLMNLPDVDNEEESLPLLAVGIYDWALVLDHQQQTARLVSRQQFAETAELLPKILHRLQGKPALPSDSFRIHGRIASSFTFEGYAAAFRQVQEYLQSGDCYQINLSQCFSATASGNAFGAYLRLRSLNPAPYSAYLNFPQALIMCNSPERFISVHNGSVETKPIKGTRPRSTNKLQDRLLADELRNHPKDRAENLMIVDLLRSDLGKSCITGSIQTPKLFQVESFANVHHLVSTIKGKITQEQDALDLLRNCFPGGSITGAPKLRAMQIIEQLEPVRRSIYCGAIGYIGFDGNMDTNIAIRTLVYADNKIRCWAGGGIVADSDLVSEYQETLDKASAMLKLLQHYGGIYDNPAQIF